MQFSKHSIGGAPTLSSRGRQHGFTLIEALMVIAILVITLTLAAPNLRDFMVTSKVSSLSDEFSGALQQTRALAISNNTCMTLCAATSIATGSAGSCSAATTNDFQKGWLVFRNATCDETLTTPPANSVLLARQGDNNGYQIKPGDDALKSIMFDPRGAAALSVPGLFQVFPPAGSATKFNRNICVDASGRAWVRKYDPAAPTSCS